MRRMRSPLRTPASLADLANMVVTFPAEHRNFYDCIRSGAAPQCRAEDGAAVIELIEAILESNRTGTSVNLV